MYLQGLNFIHGYKFIIFLNIFITLQINIHFDSFVSIVLKALCDTSIEVRQAAALSFEALHSSTGPKSLDSVLPPLLNNLNGEESCRELALDGLKQAMSVKSSAVLPYLIPKV